MSRLEKRLLIATPLAFVVAAALAGVLSAALQLDGVASATLGVVVGIACGVPAAWWALEI